MIAKARGSGFKPPFDRRMSVPASMDRKAHMGPWRMHSLGTWMKTPFFKNEGMYMGQKGIESQMWCCSSTGIPSRMNTVGWIMVRLAPNMLAFEVSL